HTRFSRDWSSDVCSSDLMGPARLGRDASRRLDDRKLLEVRFRTELPGRQTRGNLLHLRALALPLRGTGSGWPHSGIRLDAQGMRSEERRVGKEWRNRRTT